MWNDLLIVEEGVALCRAPLSGYKSEKKRKKSLGVITRNFMSYIVYVDVL